MKIEQHAAHVWDHFPDTVRTKLSLARREAAGIEPVHLYAVCDRAQTTLVIVAATKSEDALRVISADTDIEWTLGNTVTRAIQRNVTMEPRVVEVIGMHRFDHFRLHTQAHQDSRAAAKFRRRQKKRAAQGIEAEGRDPSSGLDAKRESPVASGDAPQGSNPP